MLLYGPLMRGSDVFAQASYIQSFMKALGEGDLFPMWADRINQGLGGPAFLVFPRLSFYAIAPAVGVAGSIVGGVKLYLVLVTVLTGVTSYLMAKEWIGVRFAAAAASALYLLLPYRILDYYQRLAIQETTSFLLFPLVFLFARRLIGGGRSRDFAGFALSFAALTHTHFVTSLLLLLILVPWMLWEGRARLWSLASPAAALLCGLGLGAPSLLPAAIEKSHLNISWFREMPNGDYRRNFIFQDDPLPIIGIKDPVKPPVLKSAHSQLILGGLGALIALGWLPRTLRRERLDVIVLAAGCALTYLLQVQLSRPIWDFVPGLPTVQFPFRFQTFMCLTASLLAGFALRAAWGEGTALAPPGRRAGLAAMGLLVGVNLLLSWQNAFLKPFDFVEPMISRPGVVDWIEPALTPLEFEPYLRFRFGLKVEMPLASFVSGRGEVEPEVWESSRRLLRIESGEGGTVGIRSFWFPGWTGWIDGGPLPLRPSRRYGTVTIDVPPGTNTVELQFRSTPVRRAAALIGLAAVGATALGAWASPRFGPLAPA